MKLNESQEILKSLKEGSNNKYRYITDANEVELYNDEYNSMANTQVNEMIDELINYFSNAADYLAAHKGDYQYQISDSEVELNNQLLTKAKEMKELIDTFVDNQ